MTERTRLISGLLYGHFSTAKKGSVFLTSACVRRRSLHEDLPHLAANQSFTFSCPCTYLYVYLLRVKTKRGIRTLEFATPGQ